MEDNTEQIINENIIEISEKEYDELNAWKNKYLYLLAEFDNYKKNIAKRDAERNKYQYEEWFKLIINFFDDIDRVLANEEVSEGVELAFKNLIKICEYYGLKKLPHDKFFDVNKHNAISTIGMTSKEDNEIIEYVKEGYIYKDKIIRYADVIVNINNNRTCD